MNPEPRVQQRFSIITLAAGVALAAAVLAAHHFFLLLPDRKELGPRLAELRFEPVQLDRSDFAPMRLVGAWTISSSDPGMGGFSGLVPDGNELVAVTDSGVVVRLAKPQTASARAPVRELPGGPGDGGFKRNRDSEALARDPAGRGWWVAFENRDELWLYDRDFTTALERIAIPRQGLKVNTGIEGVAAAGGTLLLLPESGGRALELGPRGWSEVPFVRPARRLSGAAALSENSLLVVERRLTTGGFANALVRLDRCGAGYCLAWRKPLPVGRFDNVEAIAAEPLGSGETRLWLITDDNWNPRLRTVLIAADLPPQQP